jgi:hypothetical protein
VQVSWNERLQRFVAITNTGFDGVGVRTAERLEGPWTAPQRWIDCLEVADEAVPVCYSPAQHPEFSPDGGRTQLVTFTRFAPYDVAVAEVTIGDAIHEWRRGDDARYAGERPGDGWDDAGIAFYASLQPVDGFEPVYEWDTGDGVSYGSQPPREGAERGDVAFYAPASERVDGLISHYAPVYRWSDGEHERLAGESGTLEEQGYTRGDVAFYAP